MTIEINNVRGRRKGVLWNDLQTGVVYVDCYGSYMMAVEFVDETYLVNLSNGDLSTGSPYGKEYDEFTPTKCKLEVFA